MIQVLQQTFTDDEYIKLACALFRDLSSRGYPVRPEALRYAERFELPEPELRALVGKLLPGMQAILEKRAHDVAA